MANAKVLLATALTGAFTVGLAGLSSVAHSDTLQDIYELALKNDPQLKAAEATYRAGLESKNIAFSSLLPQLSASAFYEDSESTTESVSFDDTTTPPSFSPNTSESEKETDGYSITLQQALIDFSAYFNFRAGEKLSEKALADFATEQQALITRVTTAYFNVLRAQENLKATLAEERATKRQLEQTKQRFDVGLIAITEVHESQAAYDSTVANRLGIEGELYTATEAISQITNHNHGALWQLSPEFAAAPPIPNKRQEWVNFALKNSPAIRSAILNSDAAYATAKSKKAGHLPTLGASYVYSDSSVDGTVKGGGFDPDAESDSKVFTLSLSVPLYSGGGVSAQRRQAYEQHQAANFNRELVQRRVIQNTKASFIAVMTDMQRLKARQQAIVSTRSALEATQAGYNVGTRNIVDVLQAQRNLYAAIRDEANARFDYIINMFKLKQEAGTLSPADISQLDSFLVKPEAPKASDRMGYDASFELDS